MIRLISAMTGVLLLLPSSALLLGTGEPASPPAAEQVLQRFLSGDRAQLTAYRAIRHFEARNSRFNAVATMTARTELSPERGFTYEVLDERGSGSIRSRVLRPMLEQEAEILNDENPARYAFSEKNYEFKAAESDDPGVVKLQVKPRRRDEGLIAGTLHLCANTAQLLRVDGRLARNPSFWTTRVDFVRQYATVAGVAVPLRLDSFSHVRIAGDSTLAVVYEYEMVNGVPVAPRPAASDNGR